MRDDEESLHKFEIYNLQASVLHDAMLSFDFYFTPPALCWVVNNNHV